MSLNRLPMRLAACVLLAAAMACGPRDGGQDAAADRARTSSVPDAPVERGSRTRAMSATDDRPRIVVLGDSLTAGLGLAPDDAYPALLQRRVDDLGLKFHVVNAGISGDTTAGGLSRLDAALDGDVRVLVLALGANDGLRGLPIEQLRNNLATMIERAQARRITVVLAGMEAPPNWGDEYTRAFHDVYPSLAKQYHVALVPFLLAGVAGEEALNQRDGLHPTARGDEIVADTVWRVLGPVVEQQAGAHRR